MTKEDQDIIRAIIREELAAASSTGSTMKSMDVSLEAKRLHQETMDKREQKSKKKGKKS